MLERNKQANRYQGNTLKKKKKERKVEKQQHTIVTSKAAFKIKSINQRLLWWSTG